jgi:hypothetical protein
MVAQVRLWASLAMAASAVTGSTSRKGSRVVEVDRCTPRLRARSTMRRAAVSRAEKRLAYVELPGASTTQRVCGPRMNAGGSKLAGIPGVPLAPGAHDMPLIPVLRRETRTCVRPVALHDRSLLQQRGPRAQTSTAPSPRSAPFARRARHSACHARATRRGQ